MMNTLVKTSMLALALLITAPATAKQEMGDQTEWLDSLMTQTPAEGFALAVRLARRGVTTTQPDRSVLMEEREKYAVDGKDLMAASHVVAVHFQTIAAANNYWRD